MADNAARRAYLVALADYWWCPNLNRVVEGMKGDDKVYCPCGRVANSGEARAHHRKAALKPATVDDFMKQEDEDLKRKAGG